MEAESILKDPRFKWRNDADPVGKSYNTNQCWFVCAHEGRKKYPRESTEQLWNRVLLPLEPRPTRICELGSWEGASGLWLLHNLKPSLFVSIDPWIPDRRWHKDRYVEARSHFFHNFNTLLGCEPKEYRPDLRCWHEKNVWQVSCSSQDYLRHDIDKDFPGKAFDMIYVDAAHGAIEAMTDMLLSWRKLEKNGVMLVDDYDRRWHNSRPAVLEAVRAFWTLIEWQADKIFESKRQVWFRKRVD